MIDKMIYDSDVADILDKVLCGNRIGFDEGVRLFNSNDFASIGAVANIIRKRKNGNRTYYVVNRHINYTDICINKCRFCAFSRDKDDPEGYLMRVDEIVERAKELYGEIHFTELHIVGGLNPELGFEYYIDILSALKNEMPNVHLQAFTAVEIAHISKKSGLTLDETLKRLHNAGLDSIPGGGAEVFSDRVRTELCPEKLDADSWLEVMRTAHLMGIRSNATMLYGHIETYEERVDHLLRVRALQDETGGFLSFIPLKFHPVNTDLSGLHKTTTSIDDLKVYSISRLILDNIHHIKVFWIMLGVKMAQIALGFGVDDFDGTVIEEKITHRAGATTPQGLTINEIQKLIAETNTIPVERDTLYNEVTRDAAGVPYISQC